jgi:Peptide N-acetyl-beta-D-glucosaminyl asparaginase amidase A
MDEEFWWSNVLSSDTGTFTDNTLLGYSPFREVQLLIDGQLAGVSWPFPLIFTGGIVPGFWRPVVGIDAFDLQEDEIDITPWLSVLSDGRDHTYEIRVVGITDDGQGNGELTTVGWYWVVTGKLFLWLDQYGSVTTGTPLNSYASEPSFFLVSHVGTLPNGTNTTLDYQVLAQRHLSISSMISTSEGTQPASWTQMLSYSNVGNVSANGDNATTVQMTSGVAVSSSGYSRKFAYPLTVVDAMQMDRVSNNLSISGHMDRSKIVQVLGDSAFPSPLGSFSPSGSFQGWSMATRQNGTASYVSIPAQKRSISWGETEQNYTLDGLLAGPAVYPDVPVVDGTKTLYARHVLAMNGSLLEDSNPQEESQILMVPEEQSPDDFMFYAVQSSPNSVLGRGPPA